MICQVWCVPEVDDANLGKLVVDGSHELGCKFAAHLVGVLVSWCELQLWKVSCQ